MSGGKGQEQDQEAAVMANNIQKVEEDARQAEKEVRNKGLIIPQNFAFHQSEIKSTHEKDP